VGVIDAGWFETTYYCSIGKHSCCLSVEEWRFCTDNTVLAQRQFRRHIGTVLEFETFWTGTLLEYCRECVKRIATISSSGSGSGGGGGGGDGGDDGVQTEADIDIEVWAGSVAELHRFFSCVSWQEMIVFALLLNRLCH
jgi:hypothetical protein